MQVFNLSSSIEQCDPSKKDFEVVERKGLGHPDTLADGLAESISNAYSKECLERWGVILHHNLDKLYIGGGLWEVGYGIAKMKKPVQIRINGRISSSFKQKKINYIEISRVAISDYLNRVVPNLKIDENFIIDHNSTQNTIRKNWFEPESYQDLPELTNLNASDTAICVGHAPLTLLEKLCLDVERYFWVISKDGNVLKPRFDDIGQDIKVMGIRKKNVVEIIICLPFLSSCFISEKKLQERKEELEFFIRDYINKLPDFSKFNIKFTFSKKYLLGLGSCIECGEEGLVGRGNSLSGLISVMRPKGNEAYFGKNPMYHVGRVQMFQTRAFSRKLYEITGLHNTVYTIGVHSNNLIPPQKIQVHSEAEIDHSILELAASETFDSKNYLSLIINNTITDNFTDKYF